MTSSPTHNPSPVPRSANVGMSQWRHHQAEVENIATKFPVLENARPHLRALSFQKRCRLIDLINGYLTICPDQVVNCKTCKTLIQYQDAVKGKCFDCIAVEYEQDSQGARYVE